jgi:hypothetical protein
MKNVLAGYGKSSYKINHHNIHRGDAGTLCLAEFKFDTACDCNNHYDWAGLSVNIWRSLRKYNIKE